MSIRTNALKVQAFAGALYGIQVGTTTMAQVNADITSGGFTNTINSYYASSFGSATTASVAATVAANLGLTGDALASGTAYITAQLNGAAAGARGAVISNILDLFAGLASDATFGAAATAWNTKVDAANAYTGAANVAVGTVVAQNFTLNASTTEPDDMTGTAAADTFTASLGRLQSADALDGAGGSDVLNARLGATVTPVIANIETLNIEATSAASLDGANITGATSVNVTGGATLTYLAQDGEAFSVAGAGTGLTVTRSATDTTTDAITVTLKDGKAGTVSLGDAGNGADYEVVNLVVAGAGSATITEADADADQTDDGWAESTDKIVVTGSGDYTLNIASNLLGDNATAGSEANAVIDATAHTGKLTVDLGTLVADNVSAKTWDGVDVIALGLETATDVLSNVASGTEVVVKGSSAGSDLLTVTTDSTATTDTLTITLNNPTAGSNVDIAGIVADGFETLTVNSTGKDSSSTVVKNVIDDIAGTTDDKNLIFAGDKFITATGIEATYTNIQVTNTAGADLTVDAGGALSFTGGAAADRLELDTIADLTAADTLAGGAGRDTLAFSAVADSGTFSAAQKARVSGFEILEYTGAQDLTSGNAAHTIDVTDFSSIDTVRFAGAVTTDSVDILTIKGNDGLKVSFGDALTIGTTYVAIDVKDAANAGTNNTVTVALEKESDGAALSVDGWKIDGVENQVIEVKGVMKTSDIITVDAIQGAQLQTLTIKSTAGVNASTGKANVAETIAITAVTTTLMHTLDATAATGAVTFTDVSAFIATGATLKGGSAVDTFTGGVGADVIQGNAGNDVLNGDEGNDNIDGGAGADNINGDVGADTMTGGAGKDVFVVDATESTEAAMDVITDFKAIAADQDFDTLDLTGVTVTSLTLANAIDITGNTTETEAGTLKAYSVDGIIKLSGTEAANVNTLAEWIDVAEAIVANVDGTADATTYQTLAFEFSGDTYVVQGKTVDVGGTETVTTGAVVKLVGVTGLTAISETEAANTIHIA